MPDDERKVFDRANTEKLLQQIEESRAVFLDGIRWSAEPGSEVMRQLHLPPTFRSKKRERSVRPGKNSAW